MQYMTMAQAVGEAPPSPLVFIPAEMEDFDPYDQDEIETLNLAMEMDMHDRLRSTEQENARLRALLDGLDKL
jgi:hypothetical protein